MKRKIIYFTGMGILLMFNVLKAQQISPGVLQRYSPAVISRVYSITSRIDLTFDKQIELANAYVMEDSLALNAIKAGATYRDIALIHSKSIANGYDSIINKLQFQKNREDFILDKINYLNSIKELSNDKKSEIGTKFLEKALSEKTIDNSSILLEILPNVIQDTIYYTNLFRYEIESKANTGMFSFPIVNGKPFDILNMTGNLIYNYQKKLALFDYVYPRMCKEKKTQLEIINNHYIPLIDSSLIQTGFSLPNTQFSYALRINETLKLSENQRQQLIAKNAELGKVEKKYALENNDVEYNADDFTRKNIKKILDDNQYTILLQLRLQKAAEGAGLGSWRDMKKFGMVTSADSVKVLRDLYFYNIQRQVIKEKYFGQPERN